MGMFSESGDWSLIFYMIAGLGLMTLFIALPVQEKTDRTIEVEFSRGAFSAFKDKSLLLFMALGIIYPLALYSVQGMISAYLNEGMGISMNVVGLYTSVFGIGTIFGGIIGGPLMKKFGERTSVFAALLITAGVTYILAITPSAELMWTIVFLFGFAFGYYETVYFAMGMDFCDPRIAAFMFACIMAVGNIGIGLGAPLAGILVEKVGFRSMFLIFATIHLLALPIVFLIFRLKKKSLQEA
jgi:PAT family beta-lactamase induction signal transducer AmpG